jgi:hypothetical protein
MKNLMMTLGLIVALTVGGATALTADQTVGGTWMLSVSDVMQMRMVLLQKGKRITGTLYNPHSNPIALSGEFEDGRFRFFGSSKGGEWDYNLAGIGELKDDGSLAGTLTSNVGEMKWMATRVKRVAR